VKNSFFLVIPAQQQNPELLASYEKAVVNQWVLELPTANPSLATRLFYDFIEGINTVEMPPQQRLDVLEILRPHFLIIEDYLRSRLIRSGFPKGENEQKILDLVISIEKHFTIGYWMVVRELTRRDVGWFQGKNTALAIQRTIKGLSGIVVTCYMMFLPVPDWVWIDLHSLYKLSVSAKKDTTKVVDETNLLSKASTPEDGYKQILMLSLADPSGLMQKEIGQAYDFIGKIVHNVQIETQQVSGQDVQCIILMDEDTRPYFDVTGNQADTAMMYLNLLKLYKVLQQKDKFSSKDEARFSSMHLLRNASEKLPVDLFDYIQQCWKGVELKGASIFSDRLGRYIAIGLNATHSLQYSLEARPDSKLEILADSFSERELACGFEKEGVLSIGSMVSFRRASEQESKRFLGIVKKITMPKQDGHIVFELAALTPQSYAVNYQNMDVESESEQHKALIYGVKTETGEKSFIIMESFMHKDGDLIRVFMNDNDFPVIMGNRKNIGLGYWQFECRQVEERQVPQRSPPKKKGYDFI
jgi:hypothetical protein